MHPSQVLSRALNTHNYKKDVTETGGARDRNPSSILGRAQDSLYSSKTGLRRLFGGGGSSKEIAVPTQVPEEPETLEISEPSRPVAPPGEDMATRLAKVRRSSMTTYTVNLGGAAGGQVEREVRRLAGLAPAFIRPSAPAEVSICHATSFDAVEEMGRGTGGGAGAGDVSDAEAADTAADAVDGVGGLPPRQRSQTLFTSAPVGGGRGPVKPAFGAASGASGDPFRISISGDPCARSSLELLDVASLPSSSNLAPPPSRPGRPPSLPQAFLSNGGMAAAAASGGGSGGGSLSASPVAPGGSQLVGQLGIMKDRKASRHNTLDGFSPSTSPGVPNSPATPGGGGGGGGSFLSGAGSGGSSGLAAVSVLKLPTLPSTPGRAASGPQLAGAGQLAFFSSSAAAPADSRPGSSRLVLGRGSTACNLQSATSGGVPPAGAVDRRASVGNLELSAGSSSGGPRPAVEGGGLASGGGGGGGRWFQQDSEDVVAMLAGNEDLLERLMLGAGGSPGAGGAPGGSSPCRAANGTGDGAEPGLLLPRLADAGAAPDRATAQLQELWKVQATVGDQLARERQAMAAGRARRASLLEDVAGQHQPRWQVSYNVDAPVTHAKLGTVDASRRSEMDRAHLAKLVKDQKGPVAPPVPAAAVSPVVARARRLSTVMVA